MSDKTNKEKDIESLERIIKLSSELQDAVARYNARQSEFGALYHMDNIIAQVWIIARNVRDSLEGN